MTTSLVTPDNLHPTRNSTRSEILDERDSVCVELPLEHQGRKLVTIEALNCMSVAVLRLPRSCAMELWKNLGHALGQRPVDVKIQERAESEQLFETKRLQQENARLKHENGELRQFK